MKFDVQNTYREWTDNYKGAIDWHSLRPETQAFWLNYHINRLIFNQPEVYGYPANRNPLSS